MAVLVLFRQQTEGLDTISLDEGDDAEGTKGIETADDCMMYVTVRLEDSGQSQKQAYNQIWIRILVTSHPTLIEHISRIEARSSTRRYGYETLA